MIAAPGSGFAAWPSADLAGYWRFDSVAAGKTPDLSPHGRPLRIESPAFSAEVGTARSLRCDGFETSAALEEMTPLEFPHGLTLAVWVRPDRPRRYDPVVGRPNSNPSWTTPTVGLYLDDGRAVFGLFHNRRDLLEGPTLPMQVWSLVVITADEKQLAMWVNGQRVAETKQEFPVPASSGIPWYVGRSAATYFRGRIGELAVWTRALSADEIAAVLSATSARYPRAAAETAVSRDRTVLVASPGSHAGGTWRERPTRTLEGLDAFTPSASPPLDRWGGRTDLPARKTTGFFRTEQISGRWSFVTPEGHLYWNVAVNSVNRPSSVPESQAASWAAETARKLRRLGFNGISSGRPSSVLFGRLDPPMPWCLRLDFLATFAKEHQRTYPTSGHTGFQEQCPPVFHPEFATWARQYAASVADHTNDPAILGIFTDNEIQCPVDLLDRHLRLDPKDDYLRHGREAAEAWLKSRGRPNDQKQFSLKDRLEFIAYFMGMYSRIVHDAIRQYDHNHLILGSRLDEHPSQFDNPWLWPAIGPWIDVSSVNYYGLWGPQAEDIRAWSEAMGKPVMLTEWYAKAEDAPGLANVNGAGWLVHTQEDRALYYQHFMLAALETPSLVGAHYFKYLDDPRESKALDSAGGANKGLYTADGQPWEALQRRAQAVNTQAYRLIDFFDRRNVAAKTK